MPINRNLLIYSDVRCAKDYDGETLLVRHGKGDKARRIGLDPGACDLIDTWIEVRSKQLGLNGQHKLFCTYHGGSLTTQWFRGAIKRMAKKTDIAKRVHPHRLRPTGAYELANEGTPLHVIQQQLGHSNLATTSRYINHLCPRDVVQTMRAREWSL